MTMTVDGFVVGECLEGTEVGIIDYSKKERDEFGNISIIERGYTDLITYRVRIESSRAALVRQELASKRAISAHYIGHASLTITDVQGYLNDFNIRLENSVASLCTITVESEIHAAPT